VAVTIETATTIEPILQQILKEVTTDTRVL